MSAKVVWLTILHLTHQEIQYIPRNIHITEKRSSGWQPWYSLETLKLVFNVSSEYHRAVTLMTFPFLWQFELCWVWSLKMWQQMTCRTYLHIMGDICGEFEEIQIWTKLQMSDRVKPTYALFQLYWAEDIMICTINTLDSHWLTVP